MCGICGIVDFGARRTADEISRGVEKMTAAMGHRGPDNTGHHAAPHAVLGATRLAIIDLSASANQPMLSRRGDEVIVFNGEIYNHCELRRELEAEGEVFETHSDTEVLLALYAKMGQACLQKLRGMFAFAVWNRRKESLFMARDRAGEKPLVYVHDGSTLAFASEIPALLELAWVPRVLDPVAIHYGLHYVHVPAPYSAFRDIRKLPPATWMEVTRRGRQTDSYWHLRFDTLDPFRDEQACCDEFTRTLDQTTGILCRSDVPVGATLSGGLDSSSVVASMSQTITGFDTFRISSGQDANPEEHDSARAVAARYGTRHHELLLSPERILSLDELVRAYGEPVATPVSVDAQYLAAQVKQHVTVALTGSGSDELLGGYADHLLLFDLDQDLARWDSLDRARREQILRRIRPSSAPPGTTVADIDLGRVFPYLKFAPITDLLTRIYSEPMKAIAAEHDPVDLCADAFDRCGATTLFDGFMAQQLGLISQYSLVDIMDIAGMSHSLEYRAPFLDVAMIELAARIPARFKIGPQAGRSPRKPTIRRALKDRLPAETMSAGKTGFGGTMPYERWFWQDFYSEFETTLLGGTISDSGIFDRDALQQVLVLGEMGQRVQTEILWGIATMAAWMERFL